MPGSVEFLDPAPSGDPEPPDVERRGPGRRGLVVGLAVVVLLGVVFAVRLHGGGSSPAHGPSQAPVAAPASASRAALDPASLGPAPTTTVEPPSTVAPPLPHAAVLAAAPCPEADDGLSACSFTSVVPLQVLSAVRARFPDARLVGAASELARQSDLVWTRALSFALPGGSLEVAVSPPGFPTGRVGVVRSGASAVTRAAHRSSTALTVVLVRAPAARPAAVATVTALAADPRLVAT